MVDSHGTRMGLDLDNSMMMMRAAQHWIIDGSITDIDGGGCELKVELTKLTLTVSGKGSTMIQRATASSFRTRPLDPSYAKRFNVRQFLLIIHPLPTSPSQMPSDDVPPQRLLVPRTNVSDA